MTTLRILPSGHLHVGQHSQNPMANTYMPPPALIASFNGSLGEGLFELARVGKSSDLSPLFRFWQSFSNSYMRYRCRLAPDSGEQEKAARLQAAKFVDLPEFASLISSPPTMEGAEYFCLQTLKDAWMQIDDFFCQKVHQSGLPLNEFLKRDAPQWHQLGRICLHLAENKRDSEYPFAFMATYIADLSIHGTLKYHPLGQALKQLSSEKNKPELIRLLAPLDLASKHSPIIKALLSSADIYHPLAWTASEAYAFIKEIPAYESAGLTVRLPDWWKKRVRPKISVTIGEQSKNTLNADALLDFRVSKTIAGEELSEQEWDALTAAEDSLVFFKGQWVEVDKQKLTEALNHWQKVEASIEHESLSFAEGMRLLAGAPMDLKESQSNLSEADWSSVQAGAGLQRLLDHLRQPETSSLKLIGKSLRARLRPYQQHGVEWLWTLTQLKLGACLADDMGLGKTIQIIALLLMLKKKNTQNPSLLVLPASLLMNWQSELAKFAPSLRCIFVHPSQSQIMPGQGDIEGTDLVLTTYGMLTRQPWLTTYAWHLVILDEAQAIKNPGTKQTKAVKQLRAQSRIALTGTPVENRVADLWSLFDFICPGLLGSAKRFQAFSKSLSARDQDPFGPLRRLSQPYILRRLKTDKTIIADLPDKTEVNTYYHLAKKQAAHYKKAVSELIQSLDNAEGIQRRGLVLSFLLRFKQICNHPAQWLGNGDYKPQDSGKFLRLASVCEEIASRQEKVLVFTQFREMTEPLVEFLSECFGRPGLALHGGTTVKRRNEFVHMFQQETGPPFFVLSIKAGGTGLNLTQASHVIHFDRWWNPAVENQATDRAFRIGQKKNVLVHKMICRGTIEEKIDSLIAEKQSLAEDILSQGANTLLTEMSDEALIELVSLDVNQVAV